ncbi:MAG: TerC family protein, partial [Gammaproteobacteria bacterium]
MTTIAQWWMWGGFLIFMSIMIMVDMFLLQGNKANRMSTREAFAWTIVWFTLAMMFALLLWWYLIQTATTAIAHQKTAEFLTGYLIEWSLSIDNVFVFIMIFNYFIVPEEYQRRVLLYGVLFAIFARLIFILFGVWLISHFHWVVYIFGLFLLFTGIKMLIMAEHKPELVNNPIFRFMKNHLRITDKFHQERFFIKKNNLLYFTPLFLVLILIEVSDLIFAVDSIPAIFAITHDPFIVFTSNIFAILGLRTLYFLLKNMEKRFHLLKYGLALILIFVGFKMIIAHWFDIPTMLTLIIIVV